MRNQLRYLCWGALFVAVAQAAVGTNPVILGSKDTRRFVAAKNVAMMRYRCPGCDYIYDEARGDAHQGFAPGTLWAQIPQAWSCPDCAVNEKAS